MTSKHELISKSVYFPKQGILAIGDLHLGYEEMVKSAGVLLPSSQFKELKEEMKSIIEILKKQGKPLKKIIFLGDITHAFGYHWEEKNYYKEIVKFSSKFVEEKNIVIIKGNHDTIDYSYQGKFQETYIEDDLLFIHGDEPQKEMSSKKIKTIILGHIHPSVTLRDKQNIRRERYKAFLTGKFKGKEIIILPSFLNMVEGINLNEFKDEYEDYFSIIPKKTLKNFIVHVVGENKVYEFGKVNDLD